MSDQAQSGTTAGAGERNHRIDAKDAIGILVACRQDIDVIEACISPSRRGSRLNGALASLRTRIAVGEQMMEERRAQPQHPAEDQATRDAAQAAIDNGDARVVVVAGKFVKAYVPRTVMPVLQSATDEGVTNGC